MTYADVCRYVPELVRHMCEPLRLAAENKTLIDIVVPYVLDTIETYVLTPEDLPFMTSLQSVSAATDVWNDVSGEAQKALAKAFNARFPKPAPEAPDVVRRSLTKGTKGKGKGKADLDMESSSLSTKASEKVGDQNSEVEMDQDDDAMHHGMQAWGE